MGTTDDRSDPALKNIGPDGMQEKYLVLSDEERAKGFIRPVRKKYVHVGIPGPTHVLVDLTPEQTETHGTLYAKYEAYPPELSPKLGRFWTQEDLDRVGKGCGSVTAMAQAIAETYARDPRYYGGTFCAHCRTHFKVGADGEFVWDGTDERVGT